MTATSSVLARKEAADEDEAPITQRDAIPWWVEIGDVEVVLALLGHRRRVPPEGWTPAHEDALRVRVEQERAREQSQKGRRERARSAASSPRRRAPEGAAARVVKQQERAAARSPADAAADTEFWRERFAACDTDLVVDDRAPLVTKGRSKASPAGLPIARVK